MPAAIPPYPSARPLELGDRPLLQEQFQKLQPLVAEFSFANLFLFRHIHCYQLSTLDDSLLISGRGYDGQQYVLPPLSGDLGETARRLLAEGWTLFAADERFVAAHLGHYRYAVAADRDNDDYLYLRSDLAELPGKRFHKKKNRISYFTARHPYTVDTFSRRHLAGALALLDQWARVHHDADRSIQTETEATREGLELAEELGLGGVVVLTASGVAAFALGEKLNDSTYVCHFEKADPFLEGASQLVNREFSRSLPAEYTFINREQDLGVSGLREAKLSYHPTGMVRKFKVRLSV